MSTDKYRSIFFEAIVYLLLLFFFPQRAKGFGHDFARQVHSRCLDFCHRHISCSSLKEQCQGDFAVLGQFCAKIITLRL